MHQKKILIVEDHPDCRELLAIVLGRSGYIVSKAGTGLEAIEQAHANRPDLIVMDFGLPGMTGDQIIMRLRADPCTEKIPVILTTGYMDAKVAERAKAAGAAKVIIKPFELDELMETIERYLAPEPARGALPPNPAMVLDRLNAE